MIHWVHESYPESRALEAATAMPVILENGRKVFGPPPDFSDPRPTYRCELYVTRIPQHLDELCFLVWLHRIGRVYEFRLMMDTGNSTRGYAFIRFCTEKDAMAAFELLKYLFVGEERLVVFRSQGKNRLFVSGIPRDIPLNLLEDTLKLCFPQMQSCTAYAALRQNKLIMGREGEQNRGFAFIEFNDHEMALEAKKRLTPGRVRMWGVDLKVQWAKPKEELKQAAAGTKKICHPANKKTFPSFLPNDYCSKLRLYCLANNMSIPIVLYGPSFRPYHLQYAGVLLKNNFTGSYSLYVFEIMVARMADIHLLMCELVVKMIERQWGRLNQHSLFKVVNDTSAELVHTFQNPKEMHSLNLQKNFKNVKAVVDLVLSLEVLASQNSEKVLALYKRSFLAHQSLARFEIDAQNPYSHYYSVLPKFRNNAKLNNNFNDMEIVLLQAPLAQISHHDETSANLAMYRRNGSIVGKCLQHKNSEQISLKSQHGYGIKYLLRYVDVIGLELRECYHSAQRVNSNPIWIAGQSYEKSIYN